MRPFSKVLLNLIMYVPHAHSRLLWTYLDALGVRVLAGYD
jgi:hypothetical protein